MSWKAFPFRCDGFLFRRSNRALLVCATSWTGIWTMPKISCTSDVLLHVFEKFTLILTSWLMKHRHRVCEIHSHKTSLVLRAINRKDWNCPNKILPLFGFQTGHWARKQKIHVSKVRKLENSKAYHLNFLKHQKLCKNSTWGQSYVDLKKVPIFFCKNVKYPWNPCWPKIWQWHVHQDSGKSRRKKCQLKTCVYWG